MSKVSVSKIKKRNEKSMYLFFNVTKRMGVKRMRPLFEVSNINVGDRVIIDGEEHILSTIFNFKNGELISLCQNL